MISLATTFSGIGAIEQALLKSAEPYNIVFACDNGEREPDASQATVCAVLSRITKSPRIKKIFEAPLTEAELFEQLRALRPDMLRKFTEQWYAGTGKPNNQKLTYFANYAIDPGDWYEDIRLLCGKRYRGRVDLFVGGSPCQAFSSNGKRGGLDDTRGTLFFDYGRLINEVRPRAFIFENVQGMLVHDKGRTWPIVKQTFRSLDYEVYINQEDGVEQPLLDAQDYGIPQRRKRIYLVGIRRDVPHAPFEFPAKQPLDSKVSDYLETDVAPTYYLKEKGFRFVTSSPTRARIAGDVMGCQKANQQFNWNGDFIFVPYAEVENRPDILAHAYVGQWNGRRGVIRKFTPRECLRLMGFPDSFAIVHPDTVMYRQCGNSIVVDVLQRIVDQLFICGALQR